MTIGEFKAFIEGMDVQGAPTPEQWARIVEKLAAIPTFKEYPFDPNAPHCVPAGPYTPIIGPTWLGDPPSYGPPWTVTC